MYAEAVQCSPSIGWPRFAAGVVAFAALGLCSNGSRAQEPSTTIAESAPYLYTAARMLAEEQGRAAEVVELFERAVAVDPEAPFLRVGFAEFLSRQRRLEEASQHAEVAFRVAPDDVDVLRAYAQVHGRLAGQRREGPRSETAERALEALTRLRQLAPSDIDGMLMLYNARRGRNEVAEAAAVLEELVSYHNGNRQLRVMLLDALRDAGQSERAREVMNDIVRFDEGSVEARMERAQHESRQGNHTEAIRLLEAAVNENPDNIRARGALAEEYFRRGMSRRRSPEQRAGDLAEALDRLRSLPRPVRNQPAARLLEAEILAESDQRPEAVAVLEALRSDAPDDPRILRALVQRLMEGDEWERVREIGRSMVERADRSTPEGDRSADLGLSLVVEALRRTGELEQALDVLEAEEERAGESVELVLSQAELLTEIGRKRRAMTMLRRDVVSNERLLEGGEGGEPRYQAIERKSRLYFDLGADRLALQVLERLTAGGGVDRLMLVAEYCRLQGRFAESVPFLQRALLRVEGGAEHTLDLDGDALRARLLFHLGEALERSRRYEEAADRFRAVIELAPENSHALNYLGYMWADNGENREQALDLIRRASDLEPDNGAFVDSLGWVLFRLGRFEQARRHLERANRLVPEDPTILEHLGDVYVALGDPGRAREVYEEALALNDEENVESVRRKLGELSRR